MSTTSSEGTYPVIPPDELKCVWMAAGVLTYQLCDRRYDCDGCPLDSALHRDSRRRITIRGPAADEGEVGTVAIEAAPWEPLHQDRLYSRGHCWVLWCRTPSGSETLVRVGLEPRLASAIFEPKSIVHVEPDLPFIQGDTVIWIVTEGGTFGVPAPLSGSLRKANPVLRDRPQLLSGRPLDDGWLFEMWARPYPTESAVLMSADAAARLYDVVSARFHESLRAALRATGAPRDPQTADLTLPGVARTLGPAHYFSLLRRVYGG